MTAQLVIIAPLFLPTRSTMQRFSNTYLDAKRLKGDELADKAVSSLFEQPDKAKQWRKELLSVRQNAQELPVGLPQEVYDFFEESSQLPSWANPSLMREGAVFFSFHSQDIMSLLGFYALPYCYASAKGAQVLHQSQRMGYDTMKRLTETGNFVFEVLAQDAFAPSGQGLRSIQQVRLLHASIRYHIMERGNWDKAQYGLPINQEDMAGTNIAFSLIILRGLRKLGHVIPAAAAHAYLHLWAVIGHLLGIDEGLFPQDAKEAYWFEKQTATRHFEPSEEGRELMRALMDSFKEVLPPALPQGFAASFIRYLMGEELSQILGVPPADWSKALVWQRKLLNVGASLFVSPEMADVDKRLAATRALTAQQMVVEPGYGIAMGLGR